MTRDDKRHYWVISMEEYDIDWETHTVRDLRETFIDGLEKGIKYISVINKKGENMCTSEKHSTMSLKDEDYIEVFDDEGNLDVIETANVITKDFLDNRAMIAMRFEKDMYDELGNDKSWIDKIMEDKSL
ncbi:MAG: hypothetical protein ACXADW_16615 [Candidatus Hodarchaeales archaeon]